ATMRVMADVVVLRDHPEVAPKPASFYWSGRGLRSAASPSVSGGWWLGIQGGRHFLQPCPKKGDVERGVHGRGDESLEFAFCGSRLDGISGAVDASGSDEFCLVTGATRVPEGPHERHGEWAVEVAQGAGLLVGRQPAKAGEQTKILAHLCPAND